MIRTKTLLKVLVDSYFRWEDNNPDRCWCIRDLADDLGLRDKLQEKLTDRAHQLKAEAMKKKGVLYEGCGDYDKW